MAGMAASIRCGRLLGSGVWELFLPGVQEGAHYKFEISDCRAAGSCSKSDPFAFFNQHGTETSSLVYDLDRYHMGDRAVDANARASEQLAPQRRSAFTKCISVRGGAELMKAIAP